MSIGAALANRPLAMATAMHGRRYCPGPLTVNSSRLDSFLPSSVQMAPWASQSSVTGRMIVTVQSRGETSS